MNLPLTFIRPTFAEPKHRLQRRGSHGFRNRHVGNQGEVRGQHGLFWVGIFGETDRNDVAGGVGHGGGVAFYVRQSNDDGLAAVPDSAVKCLRCLLILSTIEGWVIDRSGD